VGSTSTGGDTKSELRNEWMQPESLVSHSALNQLSYFLIQLRNEVKLHTRFNTGLQNEKIQELLEIRALIMNSFKQTKSIEKRI
jgi:hypothetical protein